MNKVVFDASAFLALLQEEPGHQVVEKYLPQAVMSTVNLSEVALVLRRHGMKEGSIAKSAESLLAEIVNFNANHAYQAAKLVAKTKDYGLSFGNRSCIALGLDYNVPVITADRIWKKLNLNLEIILIR